MKGLSEISTQISVFDQTCDANYAHSTTLMTQRFVTYYLDKNDIHVPPEAIITDSVALACLIQQLKPTALAAIPAFDFNPAGETEHMQNYELLLKLLE